ncbi:hypothetical protein BD626DRAFT_567165 [Schizophyllum amplum]|uniref:Uncharacterized protein n=1 Tax=Schizophyllum amplum TaxID=97359 RepID=A0A550CKA0_9AGAR|nr:hypothetical protein BD626DRAFT_567165 [Auriculariopsis ampla]
MSLPDGLAFGPDVLAFVNGLLSAKDAEIQALKAEAVSAGNASAQAAQDAASSQKAIEALRAHRDNLKIAMKETGKQLRAAQSSNRRTVSVLKDVIVCWGPPEGPASLRVM